VKIGVKPTSFSSLTLSDRAFDWLEEAIIKGDLAPGERLDEVSLAEAFGISRGPVREAIRRLEGKRLVERTAHSGVRVTQRSQEDLFELLYVREALEGMACRLATSLVSEATLDELGQLLNQHAAEHSLRSGQHYYQKPGDYDFHFRIIHESGNQRLIETLCDDLYHMLRIYRYQSSAHSGRAQGALDEHRRILKAMRARDPDLAEFEMRAHIRRAREITETEGGFTSKPPKLRTDKPRNST